MPTPARILITAIRDNIADLAATWPTLTVLMTTRPRGLGFATPDALEAQAAQARAERRDLTARLIAGGEVGPGDTADPANMRVMDAIIDTTTVLNSAARKLADLIHTVTDAWPRSLNTADAEIDQLLDLVDHRVLELSTSTWDPTHTDQVNATLAAIGRDLARVSSRATELADQRLRTSIDGGCPHCHRETLVAIFNTWTDTVYVDVIRCDRDRATSRYEICICEDPWCFCKQDATSTSRRHSWGRDEWWRLAERITLHRAAAS